MLRFDLRTESLPIELAGIFDRPWSRIKDFSLLDAELLHGINCLVSAMAELLVLIMVLFVQSLVE